MSKRVLADFCSSNDGASDQPKPKRADIEEGEIIELLDSDDDDDDDDDEPIVIKIKKDDTDDSAQKLFHVYKELDVSPKTQEQLADSGIACLESLLGSEGKLEQGLLPEVNKVTQQQLFTFCGWYGKHGKDSVDWVKDFNDGSFAAFDLSSSDEAEYRDIVEKISGRCDSSIGIVPDRIITFAASKTIRALTKSLTEECQSKFEPALVVKKCLKALLHPSGKPNPEIHLVSGKTQAGKSAVKAVCAAVFRQFDCFLIVITKGNPARDDLRIKLNRLLWGCRDMSHSDLLVIADTAQQISKAAKRVRELRTEFAQARFGVIVDEADAMYRTSDGTQRMEQAYKDLMELGPSFRMEISATLVSVLQVHEEQGNEVDLMEVMTIEDYSGIKEMRHMKDSSGRDIYLHTKDLVHNSGVHWNREGKMELNQKRDPLFEDGSDVDSSRWSKRTKCYVPYTNDSMMQMFTNALEAKKKGTLVLVATNPRVYAPDNVVEQASSTQDHFRSLGMDMIAVVATGRGLEMRMSGYSKGRFVRRSRKTISEVIQQLDSKFGLDVPIFVFGYSRLCRSVAFRSENRVPTHMVLCRGPAYYLEDYIQALGRATFNGLSVLRENGHEGVTILTDENDFKSATKYYVFVQEIITLISNSRFRPIEAVKAANQKLPDAANFFRHTNRSIGRRKDLNVALDANVFESPFMGGEKHKKDRYFDDEIAQQLFYTFLEMANGDNNYVCSFARLAKKYNELYDGSDRNEIKRKMNTLVKDVVFQKAEGGWMAKNLFVLEFMLNPDLDVDGDPDSDPGVGLRDV